MNVKLSDGHAELRGAFAVALAFVKSLPSRRFDGTTKTWEVPMTIKALGELRFPEGVSLALSGGDICYGRSRWFSAQELQQGRAAQAAKRNAETIMEAEQADAYAELDAWLTAQLTAILPAAMMERMHKIISNRVLYDAIERGTLQFSTPARQAQIEAIDTAYWQRADALSAIADRVIYAAEESAYDDD